MIRRNGVRSLKHGFDYWLGYGGFISIYDRLAIARRSLKGRIVTILSLTRVLVFPHDASPN